MPDRRGRCRFPGYGMICCFRIRFRTCRVDDAGSFRSRGKPPGRCTDRVAQYRRQTHRRSHGVGPFFGVAGDGGFAGCRKPGEPNNRAFMAVQPLAILAGRGSVGPGRPLSAESSGFMTSQSFLTREPMYPGRSQIRTSISALCSLKNRMIRSDFDLTITGSCFSTSVPLMSMPLA